MVQSIYLAGKIGGPNDWRLEIVKGLVDVNAWSGPEWPVLPAAVAGLFNYVGPYAACTCGHHCGDFCGAPASVVYDRCLSAIRRADIVFAWIEDGSAYGTLVELGYAAGIPEQPSIVVATPFSTPDKEAMEPHDYSAAVMDLGSDLWFALQSADLVISEARSPLEALLEAVERIACDWPELDSPIEYAFWEAHLANAHLIPELVAQHEVLGGRYRLDFAVPRIKVAIELDGYEYHSSREAFVKDRQRQRHLEALGWRFIRFAGTEVKEDPVACYRQAAAIIQQWGLA